MKNDVNEAREKAYSLMQELIDTADFDEFLKGEIDWCDWYHLVRTKGMIPDHIEIHHGATRMVFWDIDDCKYVFKLNKYANEIDYGASEVFLYKRACEEGVGECFAWTAKVIDNPKFPIYAMAFCEIDEEAMSNACYSYKFKLYCDDEGYDSDSLTEEQQEEINGYMDDSGYADSDGMLDYVSELYDSDLYRKLCHFIDKYEICDVHCGNWGYYEGHLVLTDYAGYEVDLMAVAMRNESEGESNNEA